MKTNILKLDNSTQEKIIQQYENLRQSGICNMFDHVSVVTNAHHLNYNELFSFACNNYDGYGSLLMNFSKLMKKFDIKQN